MNLVHLFGICFKIGIFGFGGGYVILPMIYNEFRPLGMLTPKSFGELVALSQMTPGPIAINGATYVGFQYAGVAGSIVATLAIALPSFILVMLAAKFMDKCKENPILASAMAGIRPATIGMMLAAVMMLAQPCILKDGFFSSEVFQNALAYIDIRALLICIVSFVIFQKWKVNPIIVTLLGGVAGVFIL